MRWLPSTLAAAAGISTVGVPATAFLLPTAPTGQTSHHYPHLNHRCRAEKSPLWLGGRPRPQPCSVRFAVPPEGSPADVTSSGSMPPPSSQDSPLPPPPPQDPNAGWESAWSGMGQPMAPQDPQAGYGGYPGYYPPSYYPQPYYSPPPDANASAPYDPYSAYYYGYNGYNGYNGYGAVQEPSAGAPPAATDPMYDYYSSYYGNQSAQAGSPYGYPNAQQGGSPYDYYYSQYYGSPYGQYYGAPPPVMPDIVAPPVEEEEVVGEGTLDDIISDAIRAVTVGEPKDKDKKVEQEKQKEKEEEAREEEVGRPQGRGAGAERLQRERDEERKRRDRAAAAQTRRAQAGGSRGEEEGERPAFKAAAQSDEDEEEEEDRTAESDMESDMEDSDDDEEEEGEEGEKKGGGGFFDDFFNPVEELKREEYVPSTWWEARWYDLVKGTSFDPNEEGKRRSIFGYYETGEPQQPDLPFLPGGDPPDDAELPAFEVSEFYNTTWVVGILWKGPLGLTRTERKRVFLRDDGRAVWDDFGKGAWSYESRSNVLRFGRETFLSLDGRRSFPTLLTSEKNRYYLEGFVIGWAPFTPLDVYGMWQAYREDVDEEERGPAPWEDYDQEAAEEGGKVVKA